MSNAPLTSDPVLYNVAIVCSVLLGSVFFWAGSVIWYAWHQSVGGISLSAIWFVLSFWALYAFSKVSP